MTRTARITRLRHALARVGRRRNWATRARLAEAVLALALARVALRSLPMARLSPHLGRHMAETAVALEDADAARALRVGRAVQAVAPHLPWRCLCMEQALAARLLLRRRGISSTLYLGAGRGAASLEAHAWLRSGAAIITGAQGRERFVVVATFAQP